MFMPKRNVLIALAVGSLLSVTLVAQETPRLGKPVSEAQLLGWDLIISLMVRDFRAEAGLPHKAKWSMSNNVLPVMGRRGRAGLVCPVLWEALLRLDPLCLRWGVTGHTPAHYTTMYVVQCPRLRRNL